MVDNQLRRRGITCARTLEAMAAVPREAFFPADLRHLAYDDGAHGIGEGQTISQPYMVALMTQTLQLKPGDRVLEIGTGSGYQAAVLAAMGAAVHTIERLSNLQERARQVLEGLHFNTITFHAGDGTLGLPAAAPFDGIVVTAGAPEIPRSLKRQIRDGGHLVIPVGERRHQSLIDYVRHEDGTESERDVCGCVFVPLVGEEGWDE